MSNQREIPKGKIEYNKVIPKHRNGFHQVYRKYQKYFIETR